MLLSKQLFGNVLALLVISTHSVNCTESKGLIHDGNNMSMVETIKDHKILFAGNNNDNSSNKNSSDGSDFAGSLKGEVPNTDANSKIQNGVIYEKNLVNFHIVPKDSYAELCKLYPIPYTNWNNFEAVNARMAELEKSVCEEAVYREFDPYVAVEHICNFEMLYSKYKYVENFRNNGVNIETHEYLDAIKTCYYAIKYNFEWLDSVRVHRAWVLTKVSTDSDIVKNEELFTAYSKLINSDMSILRNYGSGCLTENLSIRNSSSAVKSSYLTIVNNWISELIKLSSTVNNEAI